MTLENCTPELSLAGVKAASRWLSAYAHNVHSQAGEDGILAKSLAMLPDRNQWCIEFGAWDGRHLSNTLQLVSSHGYRAVLIEGDPRRYRKLKESYPYRDRAICLQAYVGWTPDRNLDSLLAPLAVPHDPDLLCIDVDGNDLHIWRAVERTRPKLVLIEYNPTIPNSVSFIQAASADVHHGNSARALVELGKEKGYELIAATRLNLLFSERTYFPVFDISDNSLEAMRDDSPDHVFCGYDGTVFVHGAIGARWHRIWLSAADIQVLPHALRRYPAEYAWWERWWLRGRQLLRNSRHEWTESAGMTNHEAEQRRRAECRLP